jgi:hypothetical protein
MQHPTIMPLRHAIPAGLTTARATGCAPLLPETRDILPTSHHGAGFAVSGVGR